MNEMTNAKEILVAALNEATTQQELAKKQLTIAKTFCDVMRVTQETARVRVAELRHLLENYPDK
jgi:hypothetical protein